jgi:phosphonate transport system permease protein
MPRRWSPPPLIANPALRYGLYTGTLVYLVLAVGSVQVNWTRVADGMERGWRFVAAFLNPDFSARWGEIVQGMQESLTMTFTATVVGVALSIPVGLGAARNLAPRAVYLACRAIIAVSRSLQEVIIAILFVAMVGFGPFAGFLTISFATIGFLSKLLAEDIEDADPGQLEAVRATGASWWQWVDYSVWPQVLPRLVGLVLYRFDINFRESAVIGIVGAGGIGATLNTAMDRYEYDVAAAILLIIIAIVMAAEYGSSRLRRFVQ